MKRKFADVLTIVNGKNQKKVENPKGEYPIYGSGGVMGHADAYLCEADTVVLGRKGNINNPIYVDRKFWNVDTAFGLAADRDVLLPKYLFYFCCRYDFERINKTVTIPSLTKKDLLDVEMEVPEIPEQQRIVDVLDRLHALKENRRRVLAMLDELVKARFVEMFGNPAKNEKAWPVQKIGDLVTDVRYGTSEKASDIGKYAYLRMNNLTYNGYLDLSDTKRITLPASELEKCMVRKGDVLFNRTNSPELVGKTALFDLDEPMVIAGYIIRIRLKDYVRPEFFTKFMNLDYMKQTLFGMAKGSVNQANINAQELKSIAIYVPPISLQNQFAAFVREVDQTKAAVRAQVAAMETLRAKMMQDFFG